MRKTIVLLLSLCVLLCASVFAEAAEQKIRIGIIGFDSKAEGVSQKQADIITDLFTRTLASSRTIAVFERERLAKVGEEIKLSMSGLVDMNTAIEVGKIAGVQYILMGSLTELSEKMSGGAIPLFAIPVAIGGGEHGAKATIDVRIIDTTTSETRLALSETGTSTNSASGVSVMGLTFAEAEFGGLEARAIADAVNRLAHTIRSELGGESSHVLSVADNEIIIDIGSSMGAKEGQLYLIYAEGKTILGMSGESLGRDKLPLAVVKVRDLSIGHCTCVVASNCSSKLIKRGDKIEPITAAKAKTLKFVTSRPAASSETFDQLFNKDGGGTDLPAPQVAPEAKSGTDSVPAVIDSKKEEPTPAAASVVTSPRSTVASSGEARIIPGFDPNTSTDVKVIQTYNLDMGSSNMFRIAHVNAMKTFNKKKYKDAYGAFVEAAQKYDGHYLAAYWAGVAAQRMKMFDESLQWMNRALAINPEYAPASDFKSKTLKQ